MADSVVMRVSLSVLDDLVESDDFLSRLWLWCWARARKQLDDPSASGVPPGSFATTVRKAAASLGVSASKFYRGLTDLDNRKLIVILVKQRMMTISVCGWPTYGSSESKSETIVKQPDAKSETPKRAGRVDASRLAATVSNSRQDQRDLKVKQEVAKSETTASAGGLLPPILPSARDSLDLLNTNQYRRTKQIQEENKEYRMLAHTRVISPSGGEKHDPEILKLFSDEDIPPKRTGRKKTSHDAHFEQFWSAYPRKVAKEKAASAYASAVERSGPKAIASMRVLILEKAKLFAASSIGKGDPQFIPHPSTWLNQGRYDDDPQAWQVSRKSPFQQPRSARSFD